MTNNGLLIGGYMVIGLAILIVGGLINDEPDPALRPLYLTLLWGAGIVALMVMSWQ